MGILAYHAQSYTPLLDLGLFLHRRHQVDAGDLAGGGGYVSSLVAWVIGLVSPFGQRASTSS